MGKHLVLIISGLVLCLAFTVSAVASDVNVTIRPFGTEFLEGSSLPVELGVQITNDIEFTVGTTWVSTTSKEIYPSDPANNDTYERKTTIFTVGGRYHYPLVADLDTYLMGQIGFGKYESTSYEYGIRAYVLGIGAGYDISPHLALVGELAIGKSISKDDSSIPIEEDSASMIGSSLALKYSF